MVGCGRKYVFRILVLCVLLGGMLSFILLLKGGKKKDRAEWVADDKSQFKCTTRVGWARQRLSVGPPVTIALI